MACGCPFIASDVNGLKEVVEDYGVLFPHEDHKQLAQIILDLYKNPQEYKNIATSQLWQEIIMSYTGH